MPSYYLTTRRKEPPSPRLFCFNPLLFPEGVPASGILCWVCGPATGDAPLLFAVVAVGRLEHLRERLCSHLGSILTNSASGFPRRPHHLSVPSTPAEPHLVDAGVSLAGLWLSYSPSLVPLDRHPPSGDSQEP